VYVTTFQVVHTQVAIIQWSKGTKPVVGHRSPPKRWTQLPREYVRQVEQQRIEQCCNERFQRSKVQRFANLQSSFKRLHDKCYWPTCDFRQTKKTVQFTAEHFAGVAERCRVILWTSVPRSCTVLNVFWDAHSQPVQCRHRIGDAVVRGMSRNQLLSAHHIVWDGELPITALP